jgi:hypothetical protein
MNASDKATPRPWKVNSGVNIESVNDKLVCHTRVDYDLKVSEQEANAELIVKAVNMHDELVEILCNITKEQSIPDFERSIAEAREYVNERLAKATI